MKLLITTQAVDTEDPVLGFFVRWIEEFAKHAERVEVICLREGKHALPPNVRVHSLGKERGRPFLGSFTYAVRFKWLAWHLRRDYDTVFVHMNPIYFVIFGPAWRLMGKRTALWYTHKSVDVKLRIAVFWASVVFTASRESFRLPSAKVRVMGHGIDVEPFAVVPHEPSSGALRILTTGRLSKTKRVLEMLWILDVLAGRGVAFEFTVAGGPATKEDEEYEREVKEAVAHRAYSAQVHLLGPVPHQDIPGLLAQADVFLNLSSTGSMDKAVLEPLVAGVPAVTTNEAFRDLLSPYGLFVETLDAEAVAQALTEAPATDLSRLARAVREQYALSNTIAALCRVLKQGV